MIDPIVSINWLADRLDDVTILDATYFLPANPEKIRADFESIRLPGAQLFDIDGVADHSSDLPHMMPSASVFAEAMADLGIDGTRPIVVYDRSINHFSAPRVWFTLSHFGLSEVFVLNGGLSAWIAAGQPTESGPTRSDGCSPMRWTPENSRVVSGSDMVDLVRAGQTPIFDARSQDRFDGSVAEPRPGLSPGHMSGAHCIPFSSLTQVNGQFAPTEDLRKIFPKAKGTPILSCGSGMTACVLALGLQRLGKPARIYDGSWAEWGLGQMGEIVVNM